MPTGSLRSFKVALKHSVVKAAMNDDQLWRYLIKKEKH